MQFQGSPGSRSRRIVAACLPPLLAAALGGCTLMIVSVPAERLQAVGVDNPVCVVSCAASTSAAQGVPASAASAPPVRVQVN